MIGAGWDDDNGYSSGSAYVYERDGQGNWSEAAKLIASDGAGYDNFGRSVAISGGYAVVGAPDDDDKGTNSGSAYIFDRDGDGDWIQSAKQTSPADDDFFGGSVSISGEYAVVGAGWDDDNGSSSGSAYVYERDGAGNWNEVQKLTASDGAAEDYFGFSVSISGDYAVIGAPHDDDTGPDSGSAYIFERDGLGNWNEVQKLIASDGDAEDYFGGSVSISGNYVVIGSRSRLNISSESAYVFERDELGNWSEVQKLTASDGASGDLFGVSVAISGGYAVVGAVYDDGNGSRSGSAYVFERDGAGNWFEAAKLIASDGAEWDIFGESVSISGDDAVIGAGYDDDNGSSSGSAYIFKRDGFGNWNEVQKLTASDGDAGDYVGYSVSISGDFVVLGALGDENDTESNSGSAYIFERDGAGNWIEVQKLIASDGAEGDWFGWKVSISGNDAVIGAPYDDDNGEDSGSAYIYQIEPAPVCPGDATGDLVVNLADFSQLLVDFGSTSGSAADFNGDNIVDLADFSILLVNFGNDCNSPLRAAPAGGSKKSAWPGPVNESARHFSPIKKKKP